MRIESLSILSAALLFVGASAFASDNQTGIGSILLSVTSAPTALPVSTTNMISNDHDSAYKAAYLGVDQDAVAFLADNAPVSELLAAAMKTEQDDLFQAGFVGASLLTPDQLATLVLKRVSSGN